MIWFTCKKCGKRHGRAENLASTLVFCECGQGNTVPWQSTTSPPETPPEPARRPAPPPRPRPMEDRDRPPLPPPLDDPREGDLLRRRKANVFRRRRPGFCLNHDDLATDKTCADCKEPFCPNCLVELQGQAVCGPCKNFRIRGLHRPARVPGMAVVAMVVGLVSGPVSFCLPLVGTGQKGGPLVTIGISLVGLLFPIAGLVLGWLALREIETKPNLGGRGLAMTGATTSLVGALWCVTVTFLVILKMAKG